MLIFFSSYSLFPPVAQIIMPMSNPTSKCECTAEQAYTWTDGDAVVGTGSPFGPVTLAGQRALELILSHTLSVTRSLVRCLCVTDGRTFTPSQCNNMYVFPGIGLAASVAGKSSSRERSIRRVAAQYI